MLSSIEDEAGPPELARFMMLLQEEAVNVATRGKGLGA